MSNTPRPPRLNALKHGIMSRETLITSGDCAEDEAEFSQQSTALYDQYEPEGAIEQLLVEQLIAFTWRWRRILRYENAAVRSQCRDSVEEARRPQPVYDSSGFYPVPVPGQSRDLDAELRDLDADLAALDTPDPLSARPALAGLVLESAEPEFDVSVKRVLHLRTPWREHRGYSKAQIEQVVSTCRGDDLTVGEYWAALRARITLRRAAVADEVAHRDAQRRLRHRPRRHPERTAPLQRSTLRGPHLPPVLPRPP